MHKLLAKTYSKILKCKNCQEYLDVPDKKKYEFVCSRCNSQFYIKENTIAISFLVSLGIGCFLTFLILSYLEIKTLYGLIFYVLGLILTLSIQIFCSLLLLEENNVSDDVD